MKERKSTGKGKPLAERELIRRRKAEFASTQIDVLLMHDNIASVLHTEVQGLLASAVHSLELKDTEHTYRLLMETIQKVREIAHELYYKPLVKNGLKVSMRDYCSLVRVSFAAYGDNWRYPEHIEATAYRNTLDLITNALKYAKASKISVYLTLRQNGISVTVEDNGVGLVTNLGTGSYKFRLFKVRLENVDGRYEIRSEEGEGTSVHFSIPAKPTGLVAEPDSILTAAINFNHKAADIKSETDQ